MVDSDVQIGSTVIPKGSYTLFMVPSADKTWQLVISKKTGEWESPIRAKSSISRALITEIFTRRAGGIVHCDAEQSVRWVRS